MLKLKKGIYVYAQLKIEGRVIDFYVGKLDSIKEREDASLLRDKLEKYLKERDLAHHFRNHYTVFGRFWNDLDKLIADRDGAITKGRVKC